ncbi:hypothetical protein EVAR_34673_1 [Eumeta japonica]|uniref:Uncharacterized protein n=1 Tax=Eumeta variegata TaxID=151549 RepID=A0A4C1VFK5_EUMVA|nr:hypothetical protein EVAR_34673_1 [Eumeta japonica]
MFFQSTASNVQGTKKGLEIELPNIMKSSESVVRMRVPQRPSLGSFLFYSWQMTYLTSLKIEPRALAFSLQGTANLDGRVITGLGECRSTLLIALINSILDDINTTDEVDSAIGALTNHVRTVVEKSGQEVLASSNRRRLPDEILD